jgi:translation initiation factor 4G
LFDDVFRLAKLKDAQIIAKGLSAAVEEGVVDKDSVKTGLVQFSPSLSTWLTVRFEGRIVTLDDESIDFPAAYKAVASIIRSLSMTQEEIDSLLSKVDVYGEPKVTPKMHLEKALGQVDEEAASA